MPDKIKFFRRKGEHTPDPIVAGFAIGSYVRTNYPPELTLKRKITRECILRVLAKDDEEIFRTFGNCINSSEYTSVEVVFASPIAGSLVGVGKKYLVKTKFLVPARLSFKDMLGFEKMKKDSVKSF